MFIETNEEYSSGIKLDVYNDVYSLLDARKGTDDIVRVGWCKKEIRRGEYTEKNIPMGVRLGKKAQAIKNLEIFLKALQDDTVATPEDDDVPF